MLNANFRKRVTPNKAVLVKRSLPGKIKITVSKNQEVAPHDVLGTSEISAGFSTVNIARELGASPQDALKYLQRPLGATFFKGELMASKKGFFSKKNILAPTDCILESYDQKTGELRVKFLPKEMPLVAGVYGIVDEVNTQTSEVFLKAAVTEIRGIYGTGGERGGFLNILSSKGDLVSESKVDANMKGHILVTGALIYGEALRRAAGFGVSGIISGGFNVDNFRAITGSVYPQREPRDVGMTIVATEGFGLIPIGDDVSYLISSYQGRFIFIDGNKSRFWLPSIDSDSILTLRKIALPKNSRMVNLEPNVSVAEIRTGVKARIIWPPFMGLQGNIAAIDKSVTVLESGISTYMLTIETPSKKIKVPFSNIELI